MKKTIMAIACCLLSATAALAQNTTLTAKLQGVKDGDKIGLILVDGESSKSFVEGACSNGTAVIKFDIPEGRGFYIAVNGHHTGALIVLDKSDNATMTGNVSQPKGYYRVENLNITGSKLYTEYQNKKVDREKLNILYDDYHKNPICAKLDEAYKAKDTLKMKELKKSADWVKFDADEKAFFTEVKRSYKVCEEANKDSWFGPFFMLTNYSYLTKENLPAYEQFPDDVKNSFYGKIVHDKIVPPSMEGKTMPDFTFTDYATKKKTSLKEALKGKKYLLLDFWASWCKPCRKEIPNIMAQYKLYKDKGFQVISISADAKEDAWLKALSEEKLPWLNDRDGKQGIANLYKVQYYPTIYLLDSDGKVIAKDFRGEELAKKLAELFK